MSAAEILKRMEADGVRLALSASGSIKTIGDGPAVDRWLSIIREKKAEIKRSAGLTKKARKCYKDSAFWHESC